MHSSDLKSFGCAVYEPSCLVQTRGHLIKIEEMHISKACVVYKAY